MNNRGSDFIDREARKELSKFKDGDNALRVPLKARSQAKALMNKVFQGEITHDKVNFDVTTRKELKGHNLKREQGALEALLAPQVSPQSIEVFLRLVRLDPVELLRWTEHLRSFFCDSLLLPFLPPALSEFLKIYQRVESDLRRLKVFGAPWADPQLAKSPSIHDMLDKFQQIFKDVKPAAWTQISSLHTLSTLVKVFRDKIKDNHSLQCKMNVLRMVILLYVKFHSYFHLFSFASFNCKRQYCLFLIGL